jgi:hypothetical protein
MTALRHDRIFHLGDSTHYPGAESLDMAIYLPWSKDMRRRVWLMVPQSAPTISVDDATLVPQHVSDGEPRWIDYGTLRIPLLSEPEFGGGEFFQLRLRGMRASECAASFLVITNKLDLSLAGCSLVEAERRLWGLARCDAGSTTLRPARVTVGAGAAFVARYTAGPKGLPAGGLVRFNVPGAFSRPQTDDPDAPGFVSIADADGEVSVVSIETSVESHEKTDIICRLDEALSPSESFSIQYRTDRTYIFPTELGETDRPYWYSQLPPLAAAAALSGASPFVSLEESNGNALKIVPGPSERLHLFLPGRRFASEELSLKGTFTDHYRNSPPTGPIDAEIELWLEGGPESVRLGSPAGHFVARHRFEIALPRLSPGVYRAIAYRTHTREEVARSNPLEIMDEGDRRERLYWGEIHAHTEMSDGSGDYGELYRHAQDEGCLEFAAATDHAKHVTDNQWHWMQEVTNSWNQPGRFITLVGYETQGIQKDRCVYTSRSRLKLFRGNYPPTNTLNVVWGHFHNDEEVVAGPHATMVHKTLWEQHDPSVERFAEIYSMWGASDFREGPLVPDWIEEGRGLTVNDILMTGAKLGFTGGGDCHEGRCGFSSEDPDGQGITPHTFAAILLYRCGMTAALLPSLDRVALVQAIRNRQTYATTGARILLHFTAGGVPMGGIGPAEGVTCRANIHAVRAIDLIEIIKDGRVVWSDGCGDLDAEIEWQDPVPPSGEHYYYLHIVQEDGQMAWSSPIWIRPTTT